MPLLGKVRRHDVWQLSCAYLAHQCDLPAPPAKPRIWVAGCGTMQPYVLGLANPGADLTCTDLSSQSLRIAQRRCRWHGVREPQFAHVDLDDEAQWPDGPFDFIECYGVLMNLRDPLAALRAMRARLAPDGVLRLMVYPHYSRQRVFQIQRLARLLGLTHRDRRHPAALRRVIAALPRAHPLRWAFEHYRDSRNDAGIVDGFLHAGDRGFTGFQLGTLIGDAGLRAAAWLHRPWGQPARMARLLQLDGHSETFVLAYLDLWQELRQNFVVGLVRSEATPRPAITPRPHPLLDPRTPGLRLGERLGLAVRSCVGVTLPSRTDPTPVRVSGARLRRREVLLPRPAPDRAALPTDHRGEPGDAALVQPRLELGPGAANPLYDALFKAFTFHHSEPGHELGSLRDQIERWHLAGADPLEAGHVKFGLTPHATYAVHAAAIETHRATAQGRATAPDYAALRLADDATKLREARALATRFAPAPHPSLSDAALRELWVLALSFDRLLLDTDLA
ncbi:MAG: class I SAM-dependent methyltransferase [Planctomycetota bacterium]